MIDRKVHSVEPTLIKQLLCDHALGFLTHFRGSIQFHCIITEEPYVRENIVTSGGKNFTKLPCMPTICPLIKSPTTSYQQSRNHQDKPETSPSIVKCNPNLRRKLDFPSSFQQFQNSLKKSKLTPRKRREPPQAPSSTLKLLQAARGSDVLETLERPNTIVPQSFFPTSDNQTGNCAWPRFDLALFQVIQGVEILLQKSGQYRVLDIMLGRHRRLRTVSCIAWSP